MSLSKVRGVSLLEAGDAMVGVTEAIAVDAMGGDVAPGPAVAGAVAAVREGPVRVILVGDGEALRRELDALGAGDEERIVIEHASEVVTMDDHPGKVFRAKPNSSLRVAVDLVADGRAAGLVSAGNSGAVLSHCLFVLGRLPGVERPGIVTTFPTPTGTLVLCDMGANVDVKPSMLAQFGILGAHYDRVVHDHQRPRVGLLSNGTEESKGTALTRAASAILRDAAADPDAGFEYVGYVEGSEIFKGDIDVVATDGFTGNIVLKVSEGISQALMRMIKASLESSTRAKLGGLLAKSALGELAGAIHYSKFGGALLLGVKGLAMICHGRSDETAIKNAIVASARYAAAGLIDELASAMARHRGLWDVAEEGSA